jgi:hypothetical protein
LITRTCCIASWPSESAGQRQAHPWAERQRERACTAVVRARKFRRIRVVKKEGHFLRLRLCHAKPGCRPFGTFEKCLRACRKSAFDSSLPRGASGAKRPFDGSRVLTVEKSGLFALLFACRLRRAISPSRCVCSSIFSSSVSVRVRKRASAGQARWTLKTGQIKLSISPAGCTGCH